jgi:hypothetical protein
VTEITQGTATLRPYGSALRIDTNAPHPPQINDQPAIARAEPRRAVTAAPHGNNEILFAANRIADITSATPDARRMSAGLRSCIALYTLQDKRERSTDYVVIHHPASLFNRRRQFGFHLKRLIVQKSL